MSAVLLKKLGVSRVVYEEPKFFRADGTEISLKAKTIAENGTDKTVERLGRFAKGHYQIVEAFPIHIRIVQTEFFNKCCCLIYGSPTVLNRFEASVEYSFRNEALYSWDREIAAIAEPYFKALGYPKDVTMTIQFTRVPDDSEVE